MLLFFRVYVGGGGGVVRRFGGQETRDLYGIMFAAPRQNENGRFCP